MMDKDKKKKDIRLVLALCVTAVLGALNMVIHRHFALLACYIPIMLLSIPLLYFNYSVAKIANRKYSFFNERNRGDGEPSDFRLAVNKTVFWGLYIVALILALLPF